jgi:hypothetical protein
MRSRHAPQHEKRFNRRWGLIALTALLAGTALTWQSFVTGWPSL